MKLKKGDKDNIIGVSKEYSVSMKVRALMLYDALKMDLICYLLIRLFTASKIKRYHLSALRCVLP